MSFADDAETQAKNKAEDVKTDTKKTVRKGKKQVRKATGTDTTAKDAKDTANDAKDDAADAATKMKNEVESVARLNHSTQYCASRPLRGKNVPIRDAVLSVEYDV